VSIEAELFELGGDPFGVVLVIGRTDVVRASREALSCNREDCRGWEWRGFLFPLSFGVGRFGGVAEESLLVGDDMAARKAQARGPRRKRKQGRRDGS